MTKRPTVEPTLTRLKPKKEMSIDVKVMGIVTGLLAVDSVLVPFCTDGKTTLHEYLGLPPNTSLKIYGERTLLMAEQTVFAVSNAYFAIKEYYNNK